MGLPRWLRRAVWFPAWLQYLDYLRHAYGSAGAAAFAGLVFLLEGLGVPVPVEIPLFITSALVLRGQLTFGGAVLLTWVMTILGNTIGYVLGYYGGRPLVLKVMDWVHAPHKHFDRVERWFNAHGMKVVIATRWVNWGFAQNMWLSGITRVPFATFFSVMAINDLLWAIAWNWLAEKFFRRLRLLHQYQRPVILGVLVLLAVGLIVWWLWRRRRPPTDPPGGAGEV